MLTVKNILDSETGWFFVISAISTRLNPETCEFIRSLTVVDVDYDTFEKFTVIGLPLDWEWTSDFGCHSKARKSKSSRYYSLDD